MQSTFTIRQSWALQTIAHRSDHVGGVASFVKRGGIGKQLTNIAHRGRAKQGIYHRVQQGIGIAVPDRVSIVRHRNAP